MASVNTSVADTARYRKHFEEVWKKEHPGEKWADYIDDYPMSTFLKNFPTPAKNYQNAINKNKKPTKPNNTRKTNKKGNTKNNVTSMSTDNLKQQVDELKSLLQHQIENAGGLNNLNATTKKTVQNNVETTRSLIEARLREISSREEKEKLKGLKDGLASVNKVVQNAPSVNSRNNGQARRNLTRKAMNALNRMSGMNGVAQQIAELKKVIEDCCDEGSMVRRGRSGSVSSVGTNKRRGENEISVSAGDEGNGKGASRPNFLEGAPSGYPKARTAPKNVSKKIERLKELRAILKNSNKLTPNNFSNLADEIDEITGFLKEHGVDPRSLDNNTPNPRGLFGSNNFENEPVPEPEAPNPRGLFGSNNFEEEAPRANAANENKPFGNNVGTLFSNAPNAPKNYKVARGQVNAPERINEYGNVGTLFSNAPNAPKNYKVARGQANAPERINEYGNVGTLFSNAPNAPKNYKVARGQANAPERINEYGNVENLFSSAPNAPNAYEVARGNNRRVNEEPAANVNEEPAANANVNANVNKNANAAAAASRNAERAAARAEREARVAANKAREAEEKRRRNAEIARKTAKRNAARGVASSRGTDEEYFGLRPGYTERDLDVAYRNLSMMHPNQGGTEAEFKNLGQRYNRLKARFAAAENPFDRFDELQDLYNLRNAGEEAYGGIGTRAQLQAAIRAKGGVAGGRRRTQRKKRTVSRKSRKVRK